MLPSITRTRPTRKHPILLLLSLLVPALIRRACSSRSSSSEALSRSSSFSFAALDVVRGCDVARCRPLCRAHRRRRLRRGLLLHSALPLPLFVRCARSSRSLSSEALSPLVVAACRRSRSSCLLSSEAVSSLVVVLSVALNVIVEGCVAACRCIRCCPCLRSSVALVCRVLICRRLCCC